MLFDKLCSKLVKKFNNFSENQHGNFGIIMALLIPVLILVAGGVVDIVYALGQKTRFQDELDAAMLAAVHETTT